MDPWNLVARDQELAQATDRLVAGGGSVVVAGAEGVGRSRFALACLEQAEAAGFRTRRILATRSASAIPLGAFLGVFDALGDGPNPIQRARALLVGKEEDPPLVLLIDDAHLLDDVSATLVLSLAAEPTVSLLVTVRSGSHQPDAIGALWKDAGAERIDLELLDRSSVALLLEAALDGPVASSTVDLLVEQSGGAPLFLRELVEAALAEGGLRSEGGVWRLAGSPVVPPRLGDVIAARLDTFGADATRLLATLALAEPLTLGIIDDLGLTGSVAALEGQGIVSVESIATGGAVRLARPVYGQVAMERIDGEQRSALLAGCATASDARSGEWDARFRSVLWRLWSGDVVAAGALLDAAHQAYLLADYPRSLELAQAAWAAEPSVGAGHLLGFALGRAGRCQEAEEVLAVTTSLAEVDRDVVLVALARSENLHRGLDRVDDALAVCRDAEGAVVDDIWRAELVAHRAMILLHRGQIDETLALAAPLVATGPEPSPRAFVKAAYPAEIALVHAGRIEDALDLARIALPIHEQVWEEDLFQTESGVHHLSTLLGLTCSGRLTDATVMGELALDFTRGANPPYGFAHISNLVGWNELQCGRVVTARGHFRDAVGIFIAGRQFAMARWCLAGSATCSVLLGERDDAKAAFVEIDRLASQSHQLNRALVEDARGWVAQSSGEPGVARAHFDREADIAIAAGDLVGAARLLHSLARCGGAAEAADRLQQVAVAVDGDLVRMEADLARALAVDDPAGLLDVAGRFATVGANLCAAEAQAAAARALSRRGRAREAARAEQIRADLLSNCEGAGSPLTWNVTPQVHLSAREREVADLAARRLSSKEISERLGVSSRTVDNHLQRIYQKLGVHGRAHLADVLADEREPRT